MKWILILLVPVLAGCVTNPPGGSGTAGAARTDHFKIVKGLHTKADVRLLMGEPVYDGPFRPTFPARELPAGCPAASTSFHYLSHYESSTGVISGLVVSRFNFRQADVIHFDTRGVVCAVSSRACYDHHNTDRCYEDVDKGIDRPHRF